MSERGRAAAPDDGAFMRRALSLAERGWGQTAPNPMVGAVVVQDDLVVGEGWHAAFGAAHAEVEALRVAGESARGATLYVTLEPCNHHGKTAPCTAAILEAGVARVIVATDDPHHMARGGAEVLREYGVEVVMGVERDAARELNAAFFHAMVSARPFVRLKLALSLDGALADQTRRQGWLTGPAARSQVHQLRAGVDAVAVGIGTVLADDPMLTVRGVRPSPRVPPTRVVFDTSARLPLTSRLVLSAADEPVVVICWAPDPAHAAALEHAGVTVVHAATLADALVALRQLHVQHLLVEGGAGIASAFLQDALVDRLIIFRAPVVLGGGALNAFGGIQASTVTAAPRWRIMQSQRYGDDEMTVYAPPV